MSANGFSFSPPDVLRFLMFQALPDAACDISKTKANFAEKLIRVYMPSGHTIGRLVKRQKGSAGCVVEVYRGSKKLRISFSNHSTSPDSATINGAREWTAEPIESVYIPVKEMLANSLGFRSLYAQREIHLRDLRRHS
ncbi:hypothetical protein [Kyrpidia tusciae]|uniref:Uncharacterized protein n=1 Tax=Kyrpidia tusciae (strain DSM 2912 / NBRC 15312 / T2) TaxID=562970 RepID=D5WVM7_KYRT2|nr:hypothetical protein [Kyrpidia tusciae]ADG07570.1 hypothetical protein Btus_2936 [Kyrpidia tusciae DSM 2912]